MKPVRYVRSRLDLIPPPPGARMWQALIQSVSIGSHRIELRIMCYYYFDVKTTCLERGARYSEL